MPEISLSRPKNTWHDYIEGPQIQQLSPVCATTQNVAGEVEKNKRGPATRDGLRK